jgi:hypothetical protein
MRVAIVVPLSLLTAGACFGSTPSRTAMTITVYPQGRDQQTHKLYTLRCAPARGTVPNPAAACRTLARVTDPFAPVPPNTICSEIALGPQQALVRGRLRGKVVNARFVVRNSCEIERWRRVAAVVPGFPGRA